MNQLQLDLTPALFALGAGVALIALLRLVLAHAAVRARKRTEHLLRRHQQEQGLDQVDGSIDGEASER